MSGAAGQVETFDYKSRLDQLQLAPVAARLPLHRLQRVGGNRDCELCRRGGFDL
jgi:hypothetical protein